MLITVVFICGQYDVLSLIFQLLGFLAFVKGKDRAFVLWFGVAFCFKYFAAIIFLPLLILRHKKVMDWIKRLVPLLIPVLLTKLPFFIAGFFSHAEVSRAVANAGSGGDNMAANFLINMLTSSNANEGVSLFVVAYGAVLVWCYLQDQKAENMGARGAWVCMLAYGAFFGLMKAYPYWSVLVTPFAVLAIVTSPKQMYLNIILETIGYAGLVGVNIIRYPWVYFGNTMKPMIWSRILDGSGFDLDFDGSRLYQLVEVAHTHPQLHAIVNSLFVVAVAAIAYTTYPNPAKTSVKKLPDPEDCRDVLVVRFLINAVVCLLPILSVFI